MNVEKRSEKYDVDVKVKPISMNNDGESVFTFEVTHILPGGNGISLEQNLVITRKNASSYTANMLFEEFTPEATPTLAKEKLVRWMHKMADAIDCITEIDTLSIKDFSNYEECFNDKYKKLNSTLCEVLSYLRIRGFHEEMIEKINNVIENS